MKNFKYLIMIAAIIIMIIKCCEKPNEATLDDAIVVKEIEGRLYYQVEPFTWRAL